MYVTIEYNKKPMKIRVRWEYSISKKNTVITTCIIDEIIGEKESEVIAAGITGQHKEDPFIKKVGRVKALTNLFQKNKQLFDKAARTKIWHTYAEMIHNKF